MCVCVCVDCVVVCVSGNEQFYQLVVCVQPMIIWNVSSLAKLLEVVINNCPFSNDISLFIRCYKNKTSICVLQCCACFNIVEWCSTTNNHSVQICNHILVAFSTVCIHGKIKVIVFIGSCNMIVVIICGRLLSNLILTTMVVISHGC